jgi:predicted enzyme related to lactoylglutathione lyase
MPTELGYLTIPVPSVPRAKSFFGSLFDWRFEQASGPESAHIGNTRLPIGFSTGGPVDYGSLYFQVADLASMVARVRSLGGAAADTVESPSGLSARCEDDQGTAFSLWQPAPGFEG